MAAVENNNSALSAEAEKQLENSYNTYSNGILGYLSGILYDRNDAEEVLQEIFVAYARRLPELDIDVNHKAYLLRAARNRAISLLRKRSRKQKHLDKLELLQTPASLEHGELTAMEEKRLKLNAGLSRLSDYERQVVILKTQNDMTLREIAELLEAAEGTVASIYRRALIKLKEVFNHE